MQIKVGQRDLITPIIIHSAFLICMKWRSKPLCNSRCLSPQVTSPTFLVAFPLVCQSTKYFMSFCHHCSFRWLQMNSLTHFAFSLNCCSRRVRARNKFSSLPKKKFAQVEAIKTSLRCAKASKGLPVSKDSNLLLVREIVSSPLQLAVSSNNFYCRVLFVQTIDAFTVGFWNKMREII